MNTRESKISEIPRTFPFGTKDGVIPNGTRDGILPDWNEMSGGSGGLMEWRDL